MSSPWMMGAKNKGLGWGCSNEGVRPSPGSDFPAIIGPGAAGGKQIL
jgi:hypothetical protein